MAYIASKTDLLMEVNDMAKFIFDGAIDYPEIGEITDEDVYQLIKDHSRFIDRINHAKMVEMTLLGQCILMRLYSNIDPKDKSWRFYGKDKNSLEHRDWG